VVFCFSALGGLSPNAGWLFGIRTLQGVFGAIAGGGAAIGLLLGGVLTQYFSWRWCLGVNTSIAIVAAALTTPYVSGSKTEHAHDYDLPGVITATLGLLSLVYGFTKAALDGWSSPVTLTFFGLP
jgi:MFS family permease